MIFDDITLYNRYTTLSATDPNPVHWTWSAEVLSDTTVVPLHKVLGVFITADYIDSLTDSTVVTVSASKSVHRLIQSLPRRDLQLKLIRYPNNTHGNSTLVGESEITTWNAYLRDNSSESLKTLPGSENGNYTDDLSSLITFDIELLPIGFSEFRLLEISGIFKSVTMGRLIQGIMSHPLQLMDNKGYGVTLTPTDNPDTYYQVSIPSGTKLISLPSLLQKRYGVYSSNIGYYLSRNQWYVYPLLRHKLLDDDIPRLTIINVPSDEMIGSDVTYLREGNNTVIFATGDTSHVDESESKLNNVGNGWRMSKAGNLVDGFRSHAGGVTTVESQRNKVEFDLDHRTGTLFNVGTPSKLFSSNPLAVTSKVAAGMGGLYILNWEASDPSLLHPGMGVRLLYKESGVLQSLTGVLTHAVSNSIADRDTDVDTRYVTNTTLTIYAQRLAIDTA